MSEVTVSVSFSARITVAPDVLFRLVGDEAVLLNLRTERYLGLDPVGARIWQVLTAAPSVRDACDTLVQEYEVDAGRLRTDVETLVAALLDQELIEVEPAGDAP